MRLDKFLTASGEITRTEAGKLVRAGKVSVNGAFIRKPETHVNELQDHICLDGVPRVYSAFTYIMLNKPEGYVSATDDGNAPTVLELLPPSCAKIGLFPCGRLDKYTVGLMLLTNNGVLAHRLLAPKHHVEKSYGFTVSGPITEDMRTALERGVDIGGYVTAPAAVSLKDSTHGTIFIHEGKYHQIKLMMHRVGTEITFLERLTFGPLQLDPGLARGQWRYLTPTEINRIEELEFHG